MSESTFVNASVSLIAMAQFTHLGETQTDDATRKGQIMPLDEEIEYVHAMREILRQSDFMLPTDGGHLVETLSEARLLRFLRAAKFNVGTAISHYRSYIDYRIERFGFGKLCRIEGYDPMRYVPDAQDGIGRPRLLLDLALLDLSSDNFDKEALTLYAQSIWCVVDEALMEGGRAAQTNGLVIAVDARDASRQRHIRPVRLRTLLSALVGRIPARVASVEIIGAPNWLCRAWFALGPLLKSKIVARANLYGLADIGILPKAIQMHFKGAEPAGDRQEEHSLAQSKPKLLRANSVPTQSPRLIEPLSHAQLVSMRTELDAEHVDIPSDLQFWTEDDALVFFVTGGEVMPVKRDKPPQRRSSIGTTRHRREYYA